MSPVLNGIAVGITLTLILGPAFFVLLQTSIHRGFKAGVLIALGIFISDVTVLGLTLAGASQFLGDDPRENHFFRLAGGVILIAFGIYTATRKAFAQTDEGDVPEVIKVPGPLVYLLKGFFLNITNPGVWFVWITAGVSVGAAYGVATNDVYYFFAGTLGTVLATDIFKCFIANRLSSRLNPSVITWTNRVVGILLVLFGVFLVFSAFVNVKEFFPWLGSILG
ncbi:MAG: LysE family translocator [Bacteroidales bacterium]